ncbi:MULTISPECIES: hypothetical protein [Streptomyces]|uniref:hypothetical protein n=1 Tax=Streptomyces TaxID=1883 RepID=UPI001318A14D|nr:MULTISPECIES: hypothetical protein [Streptomyces]QGZ47814.1 hypothetical protein GPZ77_04910 [Streptomyces sp. QHH-9511]GGT94763.1 hypothetical protein GCM10010272_44720 [Streptomyces lateritius]
MTTARHLAAIDLLRSRAFPEAPGRTELGESGPGFHIAELATSEEFWEDDGTRWLEVADQYEAERVALSVLLAARWGPPRIMGLWSLLERGMAGEDIPEPWSSLSGQAPDLHLWRVEGRWTALGVSNWDKELPFQLLAVVTTVDPP